MSLVDPTANTVLLYSILTKESFGTTAGRIIELLSNRESCSLPEIVSKLGLRTGEVRLTIEFFLVVIESNVLICFAGLSYVAVACTKSIGRRRRRVRSFVSSTDGESGTINATR